MAWRANTGRVAWLFTWLLATIILLALALAGAGWARHVVYALVDSLILGLVIMALAREWRGLLVLSLLLASLVIIGFITGVGFNTIVKPLEWLVALIKSATPGL
ncbi:hypothetical protein [Vulcanisaeta souniana]|uniref:Uncharacterized protein n=1 Tax=Vulcanisaeta souniana JCM 11219 TaxID=1293586 RepID=A0A830EHT4_9CREN|nr:hypothetical protein [Vulcanisaeta souniana]BDR92241.1 hypothetical protein Vsou_13340 [Vulcanisaeta souniana JCM 11219]GGI86115.1 hypothetical protein GCM10007112_23910 [Vulcanisaeta souniana JCM 11219]